MFLLAFSGFFRSSELCPIRSRDVQFNESYVTISIEKRKTDQLIKGGRSVVIAESSSDTCPCSLLKLYMQKAQIPVNSDEYFLRAISASGNHKRLVSINKPISYYNYRQSFKKSFANIVPDISTFSTHSARSGGTTLAAIAPSFRRGIFSAMVAGVQSRSRTFTLRILLLVDSKFLRLFPCDLKPYF